MTTKTFIDENELLIKHIEKELSKGVFCTQCGVDVTIYKCGHSKSYESPCITKDDGKDQKIKQTHGKPPMGNLLEFNLALEEVSRVRGYGKQKYPDSLSWRRVQKEDFDDAIMRHFFNKDINDVETGLSHKAHIIVNLLFQLQLELEGINK